jgi:hypothetical protein
MDIMNHFQTVCGYVPVGKLTLPTEQPPLVDEASAIFCVWECVVWPAQQIHLAVNLSIIFHRDHRNEQFISQQLMKLIDLG